MSEQFAWDEYGARVVLINQQHWVVSGRTITMTLPVEQRLKLGAESDGMPCAWVPYPGWRFVPTPDGGMRHEKIPSLWSRIKVRIFT